MIGIAAGPIQARSEEVAVDRMFRTSAPPGFTCGIPTPPSNAVASLQRRSTRTTGIQKLLFLRVRFPDDTVDPVSFAEAEATLVEADAWFRQISLGAFGLASSISPVLALQTSRTDYEGPGGFDRFLDDARQAGIEAGWNYQDYDLEIVRHTGISGFAGGNARLGERGAQVQIPGAWVLMHEIGHNLGLSHANFWNTASPSFFLASPPLPSNYPSLPDPRSIPTHPESASGHDSVTSPGSPIEYGDPWDIMGSGDSDFGSASKASLGWLPNGASVEAMPGQQIYRLQAPLTPGNRNPPGIRELRIPGPRNGPAGRRDYSLEIPAFRGESSPEPGIVIRWIDPSQNQVGSLLLDGTPFSRGGNSDAVVPLGRTFSDDRSGVHVTPLEQGVASEFRWVDVSVTQGHFPSNRPPEVSLSASALEAAPGQPITFSVNAQDPDQDALSIYWEFSDGKTAESESNASMTRSWSEPIDLTLRIEVSDRRGGVTHAHLAVRVGNPRTRRVSGLVLDEEGNPVPGVRVYSGPESDERPNGPIAQVWTDVRGSYRLTGLPPGLQSINAFHPHSIFEPLPPLSLEHSDRDGMTLRVRALPRISVQAPSSVPERIGFTNLFTLHRTGSTEKALTVLYRLGGSSSGSSDYAAPLTDRLIIPAGRASATLSMPILDDTLAEDTETLSLSVVPSVRFSRIDDRGEPFFIYYPGWEAAQIGGTLYWVQTRPDYVADISGDTEIQIIDDDAPSANQVSLHASDRIAIEEPRVESSFRLVRSGETHRSLTVLLQTSGSAVPGSDFVPLPSAVVFAPDEVSQELPVQPIPDSIAEPDEEIVLTILPDAAYGIGLNTARVSIRDRLDFPQTISMALLPDGLATFTLRATPGSRLVLEASPDLRTWTPLRTNLLFNSNTATVQLPRSTSQRFFRTVRN